MCDYLKPEDFLISAVRAFQRKKKRSKGVRDAHVPLHLDGYLMHHCVDDQGCGMLSSPLCRNVSIQKSKKPVGARIFNKPRGSSLGSINLFMASNVAIVINESLSMLLKP